MKILFITRTPPWPESSGVQRRLAAQLQVLSTLGSVTLGAPLEESPLDGIRICEFARARQSGSSRLGRWLAHPSLPYYGGSSEPALQALLTSLSEERFDVIWVHRLELWGEIRRRLPRTAHLVVDADDLVGSALEEIADRPGSRRYLKFAREWFLKEERRRWSALLKRALQLGRVTLSNPDHVARVNDPNAYLVRNAVVSMGPFDVARFSSRSATLGFVGMLNYPPNAEAVRRLAGSLGDLLRKAVPGTRIRVIGRISDTLRREFAGSSLEFTGYVPHLADELSKLDALIMPISSGSGTRIKAVDAMSVGLPILSTPFGIQGLGLVHDRSVLVGEEDEELAALWSRLAADAQFARHLADSAFALFEKEYSLEALERDIQMVLCPPDLRTQSA